MSSYTSPLLREILAVTADRLRPPPATCDECGQRVERPVLFNDLPIHPDPCFAKRLRRYEFGRGADWSINVNALTAPEAYRLGKQTVAVIVASRRRVKKR